MNPKLKKGLLFIPFAIFCVVIGGLFNLICGIGDFIKTLVTSFEDYWR